MSDIRFNNWKHQSGTGGVVQDSSGQVGIGSTIPHATLNVGGDGVFTGIVTAAKFSGPFDSLDVSGDVTIDGDLGVGGTITYEDVSRVDATGLSTFREGFKVGPLTGIALTAYKDGSVRTSGIITATNVSAASSVTATTYYGSGANLTGITAGQFFGNATGVSTSKNVGIATDSVTHTDLVGAGNSFAGAYIGDGFLAFNKRMERSGGYYITTDINALNAGPVTLGSTMTLDGTWVIV